MSLSSRPRPEVAYDAEGGLANPDGWTLILVAADEQTVVAGWDDAEEFHQWEPTEAIVKQLMNALAMTQQALGAVR